MVVLIIVLVVLLAGGGYVGVRGIRRVPGERVGIVIKRFGLRRPGDDARVSVHGAAGAQAKTLRPNSFRWLTPFLYTVRHAPLTWVPDGTIGLVIAKAGRIRAYGNTLACHVECDYFQDGEQFLKRGGEQGRQQQVLTSGYYAINPELFKVITVYDWESVTREGLTLADLHEIDIPVGETGVVITRVGAPPDRESGLGPRVPGHLNYKLPWVFFDNGGHMGVQAETLEEGGRYIINPWFAHIVRIPTRVLVLEWTKHKKSEDNLDASLGQIVLDVQGHTVRLEMKQTVQIPVDVAPVLVRRFGTENTSGRAPVQRFVDNELGATVAGYFRKITARYRVQEFITKYDEVCNALAAEVGQALKETGVLARTTTLEEFECDEPEVNAMRRNIALQQEKARLEQAQGAELIARKENEAVRHDMERQAILVEKERRRLEFLKIEELVNLLGVDQVRMERILAEAIKARVPQIISGDGNLSHALLQLMPFAQVREMLVAMAGDVGKDTPELLDHPEPPELLKPPDPAEPSG